MQVFLALVLSLLSLLVVAQQLQPESYRKYFPVSRDEYERFEAKQLHLNSFIPPVKGIRVATFNVHFFKDIHNSNPNVMELLTDIAKINPTILLLQEIPSYIASRSSFEDGLKALGFDFQTFGAATNSTLGNMIASKLPPTNIHVTNLGHWRSLLEADFQICGEKTLTVFVTHWQNANYERRQRQSELTVSRIIEKGSNGFIVGGDFNAGMGSPSVAHLVATTGLVNSFDAVNWPRPKYTCWGGTAIDHLLMSPSMLANIQGSYVFHSLSSDHLPVLVDLVI